MILVLVQKETSPPLVEFVFLFAICAFAVLMVVFIMYKFVNFFEMAYVEYINKQLFFNHLYINKKRLNTNQKAILQKTIKFYSRLSLKQQSYFEHRVYKTIRRTEFIGKQLEVNNEMKVVIAATLVKLTFGLRDYQISSVERVIIYPEVFYSEINKIYHKGEFNLGYKALVFSWKDVVHGYKVGDDKVNLAVHELIHAIHFYYLTVRKRSTSSAIFLDSFFELTQELDNNEDLKHALVVSKFLRDYAFTNQFEFLAVLIETFVETPQELKLEFPGIYSKVKEMLNFNFKGYA